MEENTILAKSIAIEGTQFAHIPGPNPILIPGEAGAWDEGVIETSDILHDGDTYYLYYHATGQGKYYRMGVATADNPLGPFKKYGDQPILDLGSKDEWDWIVTSTGTVLKEGVDRYYMFYSAPDPPEDELERSMSGEEPVKAEHFHIGLATASHPLGPWVKYEGNPILKGFGYVGGIVKRGGKYYMYNEHPINETTEDYGPISLATADNPEGPWEIHPQNPVLSMEEWGVWDDSGYSEANVRFDGTVFHMFYGGGKAYVPRIESKENIGYAYSFDGHNFVKYGKNPIVSSSATPYAAAYSEICTLFEPPFVYLYHTLRYTEGWRNEEDREKFPQLEHLGVEVLATSPSFSLSMPFAQIERIGPSETYKNDDKLPLNIGSINEVSVTVRGSFGSEAKRGLCVHIRSSHDGYNFDTDDVGMFTIDPVLGQAVQKSFTVDATVHYMNISLENLDLDEEVSDVDVFVYLKG